MGGLDESSEFGGGNEGDVARTSAPDDNGFLLVYNLIQNVRQVLAEARIRRFNRHGTPSSHCTVLLYARLHGADGRPPAEFWVRLIALGITRRRVLRAFFGGSLRIWRGRNPNGLTSESGGRASPGRVLGAPDRARYHQTKGFTSIFRWIFADMARTEPQWIDSTIEQLSLNIRSIQRHKTPMTPVMTDTEGRSLRPATLFLAGEDEVIYSAEKAVRRLKRVAPQVTAQIIPGAGHDMTFAQTATVNERILRFLKEERAPSKVPRTSAG